jgi:hypothetical protein
MAPDVVQIRAGRDPRGGALLLLNGQMLAAPKALHVNG